MAENNYKKPVKKADTKTMFSVIEPMIQEGKTVKLTVTGYSMYPLVSSRRDAVLLKKCERAKVGDVPLIKRENGEYVLHRIVGKKDGAYFLMGDYETKREYPIYPEQVIAVAKGFYRKGRYISCNSFGYKIYRIFWKLALPIRPFLLKNMAILASIKGKKSKN